MKVSSFVSYFLAGIFLKNSIPHLLIFLTGRRNITPFDKDSSPLANLLWSGMNAASGYLLFRFADSQIKGDRTDSKVWQFPYEAGQLALSVFGALYSWFTTRQEFRKDQ